MALNYNDKYIRLVRGGGYVYIGNLLMPLITIPNVDMVEFADGIESSEVTFDIFIDEDMSTTTGKSFTNLKYYYIKDYNSQPVYIETIGASQTIKPINGTTPTLQYNYTMTPSLNCNVFSLNVYQRINV